MTTILITGANRGLGLELCKQALNKGWKVLAVCRQPHAANELQKLAASSNLTVYGCEVSQAQDIQKLQQQLDGVPIDILFNNAGVYGPSNYAWQSIDAKAWLDVFAVNTISPLQVSAALMPNLKLGRLKIIANMSSLMGSIADNAQGGSYIYRSSKAALNAVTKSLSIDLAKDGMTVVAIHPGWVQTDMGGQAAPLKPQDSIAGIMKILNRLNVSESGKFFNYDGKEIAW